MAGIGLLSAAVLGGGFGWTGPMAYLLITEGALAHRSEGRRPSLGSSARQPSGTVTYRHICRGTAGIGNLAGQSRTG
jgi:hypothetical protein